MYVLIHGCVDLFNVFQWSRHELAMLPPRPTDKEEQARVKETYKQMVESFVARESKLTRSVDEARHREDKTSR